jgi:aspartate/methionine/tyrosine aminotransferase
MNNLGTETAFEVLAKAKALESQGKSIIHLEIGEPDFGTPPNIVKAAQQALSDGYTHYGPSPGLMEVRERIAQEVSDTRNINVTADNVVITPGAKPIMFFAMLALVDEGDEVIYPNPGFPIYESMINFVGGIPVPMKLLASNNFKVDLDEISNQISSKTKLMIINSPNNPCGSVISKDDLTALAHLAQKNDIMILTDEVYRKFLYEGEYFSPASVPGMTERTIILDGFSKTYSMTGWRAGFGVMPENLVEPISRLSTNSVSCTASFTQIATLEAMNGSQDEPMKMVEEFKKRRGVIVNGLNSINGIKCPMPGGAFYVFPSIEGTGMSSKQFANDLLEKYGVACLAGESFGKYGKGSIRFSFANSMENLNEALERIQKFVAEN